MKPLRSFVPLFLVVVALIATLPAQEPPPPLKVHFIDVGQGDAVLIQSPTGQNTLYDAGEDDTRALDYLRGLGIEQVDLVVASHNHADHIGGIPEVVRHFRPPYYLDNGLPATTLVQRRVLDAVANAGSQLLEPTARRIAMGDVTLRIVPPPSIPAWDQNDNSIGMLVEFGSFRLSLAGDSEPREWAWWIVNILDWLSPVHVHKASHHGSTNGDTAAALARLAPQVVVIGVGEPNSYGHPDREALQRYADVGATVYRTDLHGTVIIEAQSTGAYTVRVERGEGAQPPPAASPSPSPAPAPAPSPTPAPAPQTFTLSGGVMDATDASRLSGVQVRISDGGNAGRSTTTDSAGAYSLTGLEPGGFSVLFSKSGYTTVSRGVTLTSTQSLSLSLSRTVTTPAPSSSRQRIGAVCRDNTLSNATGSGACSSHGGVSCWRYNDGTCTNP